MKSEGFLYEKEEGEVKRLFDAANQEKEKIKNLSNREKRLERNIIDTNDDDDDEKEREVKMRARRESHIFFFHNDVDDNKNV